MDFSKLGQAASESEDLTVNQSFERALPVEGLAFLRFVSYIELGRHEPKNPTHKPSLKAILEFELNHPKHMQDFDGEKVPHRISVRMNKGKTSKSGFRKLFNAMNKACGGGHTHFVQMLGKGMLGDVFHNTSGEGDSKKTYANLDNPDAGYTIRAPKQEDALSGTVVDVPIPEVHGEVKAFLWENPSVSDEDVVAMWNSIHIEGTREVEDAKTKEKKEISKNWIQELIMSNLDWEGSTTQALTQEHISIDEELVEEEVKKESEPEADEEISLD